MHADLFYFCFFLLNTTVVLISKHANFSIAANCLFSIISFYLLNLIRQKSFDL